VGDVGGEAWIGELRAPKEIVPEFCVGGAVDWGRGACRRGNRETARACRGFLRWSAGGPFGQVVSEHPGEGFGNATTPGINYVCRDRRLSPVAIRQIMGRARGGPVWHWGRAPAPAHAGDRDAAREVRLRRKSPSRKNYRLTY